MRPRLLGTHSTYISGVILHNKTNLKIADKVLNRKYVNMRYIADLLKDVLRVLKNATKL